MPTDDLSILRRLHRLAALLAGDADEAARILERALALMGDPRTTEPALQDRVVVLEARRRTARPAPVADELRARAERCAALSPQEREAWVLAHAYRLEPRIIARAMDCSRTATERHLARADEAIDDADGAFAAALLSWTLRLEPPPAARRRARHRRLLRRGLRWGIGLALAAALATALWVVLSRGP